TPAPHTPAPHTPVPASTPMPRTLMLGAEPASTPVHWDTTTGPSVPPRRIGPLVLAGAGGLALLAVAAVGIVVVMNGRAREGSPRAVTASAVERNESPPVPVAPASPFTPPSVPSGIPVAPPEEPVVEPAPDPAPPAVEPP